MDQKDAVIIVPARLGSTRFPRKLLYPVKGKPVILWTAERLRSEAGGLPLYFAVAEQELQQLLEGEGYSTVLTDPALPSGTDRLAAANRAIGAAKVINVQADEPLVTASQIELLRSVLDRGVDLATLATPFRREEDYRNPNKVKVVCDVRGRALYFSRAAIPCDRDQQGWGSFPAYWHLGLYAYTAAFLEAFTKLPVGRLEGVEKLEQLRALENGFCIGVGITDRANIGIDTPEDVEAFLNALSTPATA
ncbi:MAG: 3-deoxy-manno-octulosonate cytidylyltransferase [Verrucomicrobia bacterium]|nr:3-deoxy-manno-octulosonate cytidylyltransferase [Verrucomicrobiota bacterium]